MVATRRKKKIKKNKSIERGAEAFYEYHSVGERRWRVHVRAAVEGRRLGYPFLEFFFWPSFPIIGAGRVLAVGNRGPRIGRQHPSRVGGQRRAWGSGLCLGQVVCRGSGAEVYFQ